MLNCKILTSKRFKVTDKQIENKQTLVDGYVGNSITFTLNAFNLKINACKFFLNGLYFEEDGQTSFNVDAPASISRTDIIAIKETRSMITPLGTEEVFETIARTDYVYKKGTEVLEADEVLFVKIVIPAVAASLDDCTITTLPMSETVSTINERVKVIEQITGDNDTAVQDLINKTDALEFKTEGMQGEIDALETHASNHASGGSDPLTPGDIGAYTKDEVNSLIEGVSGGTGGSSIATQIQILNADPDPSTSPNGTVYIYKPL